MRSMQRCGDGAQGVQSVMEVEVEAGSVAEVQAWGTEKVGGGEGGPIPQLGLLGTVLTGTEAERAGLKLLKYWLSMPDDTADRVRGEWLRMGNCLLWRWRYGEVAGVHHWRE